MLPRYPQTMMRRHGFLLLLLVVAAGSLILPGCDSQQVAGSTPSIFEPTRAPSVSRPTQALPATAKPDPSPTLEPIARYTPTPGSSGGERFSFAVAGDSWKDNPVFREIIARANSEGDAFLVVVGDMTPQGLPEQYHEFQNVIAKSRIPVYAVPGNHDILNGGLQEFLKLYPQRYSFDRGLAHFTMVDNSQGSLAETDLQWLEADLALTTQPLKFVFAHVPPFLLREGNQDEIRAGASAFTGLMARNRVAYVFSGDLHAFRRFSQDGVNYIISGGAGSPLHLPPALGGYYHFVRVTVENATATDEIIRVEGSQ